MADKPSVGFVGVGNMGWPMAACLVKAGFSVQVNDARREVANNFVQQIGGTAPDTLKQLAAASDVVITMLPTPTNPTVGWSAINRCPSRRRLP